VKAFHVVLGSVAALVLATNLGGQSAMSTWITGLLPPEARVIESTVLNTGRRTDRGLVLWMLNPNRVLRQDRGTFAAGHTTGGCSDWVYGDHWYGPTRLSLLDLTNKRLINTIEIRGMYEGATDHGFPIPFLVQNGSYYVPKVNENNEGAPKILNLRDLTGEGVVGQFVLFEYEACAISLTTVLGYGPKSDRAVQYGVERRTESGKSKGVPWVQQVFGAKPIRPGHWDFTWEPGHGAEGSVHEQVSFDRAKQVFVQK